jgi:hypothetical protein
MGHELLSRIDYKDGQDVLVLYNFELGVLLTRNYNVPKKHIYIHTCSPAKAQLIDSVGMNACLSEEHLTLPDMKFDIVIGNPPYQDTTGAASSKPLWHKFVNTAFDACKDGGYVSLVHPGGWRRNGGMFADVKDLLTEYDTVYLNMNSQSQGIETFGATTSFDYYVTRKATNTGKCVVVGYDKEDTSVINLEEWPAVPAGKWDELSDLFAKPGEESVDFIKNSQYHTQREHVQKEQTDEYCYPCAYTITQSKGLTCWYTDDNTKGHFGLSKVIMSNGTNNPVLIDKIGEYGMTEFSFAIADTPENLPKIHAALSSPQFIELLDACRSSNYTYEPRVISALKKDFYNYI